MRLRAVFLALIGSYIREEKGRTLLTVLGVALGVAVLVSIDLANESAVASFRGTVANISGTSDFVVRGNTEGLPGRLVGQLAMLPEVRSVSPLISGNALYRPPDGRPPRSLLFLGTDFLQSEEDEEEPVREVVFDLEEGRDATSFLVDTGALLFTQRFVEREGFSPGGRVTLEVGGNEREFTVGGIIKSGGLEETYQGDLVLTDVAVADFHLRRRGLLDRIDITLADGVSPETGRARIEAMLPPNTIVEAPESESARAEDMLAAFRFNLRSLGHLAIVVGAFLIYNTMSIAVVRRRSVIGTLRAMGISRGTVRAAFLVEGALFGLAGSVLGVLAGILLAMGMLGTVSEAISINFFETRPGGVTPSLGIILFGMVLGVGGSLLAAIGPANEAATTPPATAMRKGTENSGAPGVGWTRIGLGLLLGLAGLGLLCMPTRQGVPVEGYTASLLFVAAFVCMARPFLQLLGVLLRRPYIRVFRGEGLLAVGATQAALGRASTAVCGLMISLGMAVSITVMVSSFRDTVVVWMEQVLVADLYVSPAGTGSQRPDPIPAAFAERAAIIPGIEAVDPFRRREFLLNGQPAYLAAGDLSTVRFRNRVVDGRPTMEAMRAAAARDEVLVSEPLALRHGLARGDQVSIPAPGGALDLTVNGVYYDYSTEKGLVIMDRRLYLEHFPDPFIDSLTVYLEPGADREAVTDALRVAAAATPGAPPLLYRANDDLRGFALDAFDRTFAITWLLQGIAVLVAVLGVATTLLAQILDRRHEIETLRYLGASRGRVARIIVLESSLIGLAGLALGLVSGLLLSWILTRVIMLQSFGWSIAYEVPWLEVGQIGAIVFGATLLAALLPAWEAVKSPGSGER